MIFTLIILFFYLRNKGGVWKNVAYLFAAIAVLRILAKIAIVVWAIHHISHMHTHIH